MDDRRVTLWRRHRSQRVAQCVDARHLGRLGPLPLFRPAAQLAVHESRRTTEVVEAHQHPQVPNGAQAVHGRVRRLHQHPLGDLENQGPLREVVVHEGAGHDVAKMGVGEVPPGDIDGDAVEAGGCQLA